MINWFIRTPYPRPFSMSFDTTYNDCSHVELNRVHDAVAKMFPNVSVCMTEPNFDRLVVRLSHFFPLDNEGGSPQT